LLQSNVRNNICSLCAGLGSVLNPLSDCTSSKNSDLS